MPNDDEAQKAIDELNGATVQGRAIVIKSTKPEGERRSLITTVEESGGYGGNSRGGDNRGGGNRGGY
jgi:RNA recognition motif-containing protein